MGLHEEGERYKRHGASSTVERLIKGCFLPLHSPPAVSDSEKAIELNPNYSKWVSSIVIRYMQQGRQKLAINLWLSSFYQSLLSSGLCKLLSGEL